MRARLRASCVEISVFASLDKDFYGRKWILQIPGSPNFAAANLMSCNDIKQNQNRTVGSASTVCMSYLRPVIMATTPSCTHTFTARFHKQISRLSSESQTWFTACCTVVSFHN
jgi:hypothetical protein